MTDDIKRTLTPKLRFPEFRDAPGWEETTLRLRAAPVTERAEGRDGHRVLTLSGEHGIVLQSEYFGKRIAGNNAERYTKIARNDFVYNDRTTQQSVYGTIKRLTAYDGGIVSPIYKCFRFDSEENTEFWQWYFESGTHNFALGALVNEGVRTGRFNVSTDRFLSTTAWRPSDSEQQKIADCLTSLDQLIAGHGRKLEALRAHKKGLMQQLFPREGASRPCLRFPDFRDAPEWRERKISDLLKKASIPIDVEAPEMYREIGVRSHGKGIFHKEPVSGSTLGEKRVFRVIENAFVVNIVFAWEQAVATTSKDEADMIASHRFPMYLPKSGECDVRFIKLAFLTPAGKHLLGVASPGGAGRNRTLGQTEFEKLEIVIPGKEEQTKIADAIDGIDDLILRQAETVDALQAHRKGVMQQLFPSPGRVES